MGGRGLSISRRRAAGQRCPLILAAAALLLLCSLIRGFKIHQALDQTQTSRVLSHQQQVQAVEGEAYDLDFVEEAPATPAISIVRSSPAITNSTTWQAVVECQGDVAEENVLVQSVAHKVEGEWRALSLKSRRGTRLRVTRLSKHVSKVEFTNVREGVYTAALSCEAEGTTLTLHWEVDTTPPLSTEILSGPKKLSDDSNPAFTVASKSEASTDSYLVEYSIDDAEWRIAEGPQTSKSNDAFRISLPDIAEGPHKVLFRARDLAGNLAAQQPAQYSWVRHSSITENRILGPPQLTNDTAANFTIISSEPKFSYWYRLDSAKPIRPGGIALVEGKNVTFQLRGLDEGSHTIEIYTADAAGWESFPSFHEWIVDTQPPDCKIEGPANVTNVTSAELQIACSEPYNLICDVDGKVLNKNDEKLLHGRSAFHLRGLDEGRHRLRCIAKDALGNAKNVTHSWVVDTLGPPSSKFTRTPPKQSKRKRQVFRIECSERDCAYWISIDTRAWRRLRTREGEVELRKTGPTEADVEFTLRLGAGYHTVRIRASDQAGNEEESPSEYEFVQF